jgi:hypothetical protein
MATCEEPPMKTLRSRQAPARRRAPLALIALVVGSAPILGCAPMTQQQQDAFELRRFCERNPQAQTECLGFRGRV